MSGHGVLAAPWTAELPRLATGGQGEHDHEVLRGSTSWKYFEAVTRASAHARVRWVGMPSKKRARAAAEARHRQINAALCKLGRYAVKRVCKQCT